MNGSRDPVEHLLSGFKHPAVPADLRDGTLKRASAALDRPPAPDCWRWIWASTLLRLAWAVAAATLVAAHLVLPRAVNHMDGAAPARRSASFEAENRELQDVVRLPHLRQVRTILDVADSQPPAAPGTETVGRKTRKEHTS